MELSHAIPTFSRAAVMPGTTRTSVIMLACKKKEETTHITKEEKEEMVEEEDKLWRPGADEKDPRDLEEDLKDVESITVGEVFEKALEVQEGQEEPREDGPLDLTKYSQHCPHTQNSATNR